MKFSERIGVTEVRSAIQGRDLDVPTRTRLWNAFARTIPPAVDTSLNRTWMKALYDDIWASHFKKPIDELPSTDKPIRDRLKAVHLEAPWYEVYDLVEFTLNSAANGNPDRYRDEISAILAAEMAGFRILDKQFIEITHESELRAIEEALTSTGADRFSPARFHISTALTLLSDRQNPDYRNSIKESISAVEAIVQILAGSTRADLEHGLRAIEAGAPLHGALRRALLALYGYTSDAEGIRHALTDEPNLDAADAKFMLVACSGFVVYLIQKSIGPVS